MYVGQLVTLVFDDSLAAGRAIGSDVGLWETATDIIKSSPPALVLEC